MIAQTSLMAFRSLSEDSLNRMEKRVFEAIKRLYNPNNKEVAEFLGWSINRVTGRVNSLYKKGIIRLDGFKHDKDTGRLTKSWKVN